MNLEDTIKSEMSQTQNILYDFLLYDTSRNREIILRQKLDQGAERRENGERLLTYPFPLRMMKMFRN